jgi:hypothetical protein
MKRKIEIDDPWEYQIAYMIRKGYDPGNAKLATIILWANAGDLRPLQRAIAEAPKLDGSEMVAIDGAILGIIQRLINEGHSSLPTAISRDNFLAWKGRGR